MTERILYERMEPQPDRRVTGLISTETNGCRHYIINGSCAATEAESAIGRIASWLMTLSNPPGSIAWIGGGFCIGPRLVAALSSTKQTVYEIESSLAEFCPHGVHFITGDYRTTLTGKYDVIVYDLGEPVPRDYLTPYLTPGGLILPVD